VRFSGVSPLHLDSVQKDIRAAEARLDGGGRLLIRESGTEPLIRVMAEGEDEAMVSEIVDQLCAVIADAARLHATAAE
jgi:phosphoglucosamine mutase